MNGWSLTKQKSTKHRRLQLRPYTVKAAFLFSLVNTYFFGSYVVREVFAFVGSETLESLKQASGMSPVIFGAFIVSVGVSFICATYLSHGTAIALKSGKVRTDKLQRAMFVLSLLPVIIFGVIGHGKPYEFVHYVISTTFLGKTLYLIYLYYSWILGNNLSRGSLSQQTIIESSILSGALTIFLPLRSMILINVLVILLVARLSLKRTIISLVLMLVLFLFIAIFRSNDNFESVKNLLNQVSMLLLGGAFQVDLYLIAKDFSLQNSQQLNALLEPIFTDYFSGGGGFGSFLPLELAEIFPISITPLIVAMIPLLLLLLSRRSIFLSIAVIVLGIQSLIVIRNPFLSWINGYFFMLAVTYYAFRKQSNYRRPYIRASKFRGDIAGMGDSPAAV